ncbi:actin [Perkinsus chesapeaki]|uniref:Actin n=1 Tax=Perkinsus chesapeaki TaxID=330153 RepID=A0A7J6MGN4_PERCH|nr:actin [Perkinsus chesapeaki]
MSGLSPQLSPIPKARAAEDRLRPARTVASSPTSTAERISLRRRPTVVIDMGCYTWKLGYAGEIAPRWRIRALHHCWEDWTPDELEMFLGHVLFDRLLIGPPVSSESWGDTRFLVLENMFTPRYIRDMVSDLLGRRFRCKWRTITLGAPLSLYLIGQPTALVVDIGHSSARVTPVFACVPLMDAAVESDAFKEVESNMHQLVRASKGVVSSEIFKVSSAMVEAVKKCPIDVRRIVAQRLFFIGGRSGDSSLKTDVIGEFTSLVSTELLPNFTSESIAVFESVPRVQPSDIAWTGASIYGSMPASQPGPSKGSQTAQVMGIRVVDWISTFQ